MCVHVQMLVRRVQAIIKDIDAASNLQLIRINSTKHEMVVAPGNLQDCSGVYQICKSGAGRFAHPSLVSFVPCPSSIKTLTKRVIATKSRFKNYDITVRLHSCAS